MYICAVVILSIGVLLIAGYTHAQDDTEAQGLTMEVKAIFGTGTRQGRYFPIRVTIENNQSPPAEPRTGHIRIISQKPAYPLSAIFTAECDIPPNGRKTYYLYPYVLNDDIKPAIYVQYVEREPILTEAIDLDMLEDDQRLWVEVTDEGPDFISLNGQSLPVDSSFSAISRFVAEEQDIYGAQRLHQRGGQGQTNIEYPDAEPVMVWVRPEDLPDRPEGYQAVDGLILNTRHFYDVANDAAKNAALTEWIVSGGAVIVWLGDDVNRYQGSFLTGAVDGSGWLGTSALTQPPIQTLIPALHTVPGFSGSMSVLSPFQTTYTPQQSARTLLSEGDVPILQHLTLGRGDILLSGIDLAALKTISSAGLIDYMSFMMGYLMSVDDRMRPLVKYEGSPGPGYFPGAAQHESKFVIRSLFRKYEDFDNVLQSEKLTALPALKVISVFLVAYILIVGPINYFLLLKIRHREWLWYTIPFIVTVFIAASYTWVLSAKGSKLLLTRINIVDAFPGQQTAWQSSYFGLFSPAARRYDVELSDNHDLIRELEFPQVELPGYGGSQKTQTDETLTLIQDGEGNRGYVDDAYIRIWSELHFETEGAIEGPGNAWLENVSLERVSRSSNKLVGTINLALNYEIESPYLVYYTGGRYVSQALSNPGDTIQNGSLDFNLDLLLDQRSNVPISTMYSGSGHSRKVVELRNAAFDSYANRPLHNSSDEELILAGWVSGNGERSLGSPNIRSSIEETLVLIHIPLEIDTGDLGVECARGHIIGLRASKMEVGGSGELLLTDGELLYSIVTPPIESPTRLPRSLQIECGTPISGLDFSVYGFDHDAGAWALLKRFTPTDNRTKIDIGYPNRFLAPDGRTIFIKIEGNPRVLEDVISLNGIFVHAS